MDKQYTPAEAKAWLSGYDSGLAHAKRTYEKPTTLMMPNMEETLASFGFHKKKKWVGLTEEEKKAIYEKADVENWHDQPLLEAVEAKLKEKNNG